ncbi:MAG: beta-eliminating lyase-related protein, partial [Bryobacteraceae bacterium]
LAQQESHLYNDEGDCAQRLSSLNVIPLGHGKASFTLAEVEESVDRAAGGRVDAPVGVISIESPVRRKNGELFPFSEMQRISAYAKQRGIGMHLDGARLFLAHPYSGVTPAQYASVFDTVYVSLYKYFNSSFGAILAGPRRLLENLYHARRMFGGGLPHVWPECVVAQHFLDGFEGRFARAVATAEALFGRLTARKGFEVQRIAEGTNLAVATLPLGNANAFQAKLKSHGVTIATPLPAARTGRVQVLLATNETILRRAPEELAKLIFECAESNG